MTCSPYQTKELSEYTWPDFERLFSRGNGWDFCWCMAFHHVPQAPRSVFRTRAQVGVVNRETKLDLVRAGHAHGILVYADGEPIGWCQFGPARELKGTPSERKDLEDIGSEHELSDAARDPNGKGSEHEVADVSTNLWRVTCFVVDKQHRLRGVAGTALRAALEAIRQRGGGTVEAYPVACWSHGRSRTETAVYVEGAGLVAPAWGGFNNVSTPGIVSMFEREGFKPVAICGPASARVRRHGAEGCQVLMRKVI